MADHRTHHSHAPFSRSRNLTWALSIEFMAIAQRLSHLRDQFQQGMFQGALWGSIHPDTATTDQLGENESLDSFREHYNHEQLQQNRRLHDHYTHICQQLSPFLLGETLEGWEILSIPAQRFFRTPPLTGTSSSQTEPPQAEPPQTEPPQAEIVDVPSLDVLWVRQINLELTPAGTNSLPPKVSVTSDPQEQIPVTGDPRHRGPLLKSLRSFLASVELPHNSQKTLLLLSFAPPEDTASQRWREELALTLSAKWEALGQRFPEPEILVACVYGVSVRMVPRSELLCTLEEFHKIALPPCGRSKENS